MESETEAAETQTQPLLLDSQSHQTRTQTQTQTQTTSSDEDEISLLDNIDNNNTSSRVLRSFNSFDPTSSSNVRNNDNNNGKKLSLHRCKTAPALAYLPHTHSTQLPHKQPKSSDSASIARQGIIFLIIYLSLGILIYSLKKDNFSGIETHPFVDALYFCIVTMCTIGYGDIAPLSPAMKIFACAFVLVGFGFIDILLSGLVNYLLDVQENMILHGIQVKKTREQQDHQGVLRFSASDYFVDVEKGRMRIRLKVGLALGVVVLCVGVGALVLYHMENLDWIDALYLSVMSVTTVGYGDRAFKTMWGRLFAAIWLLVSTLAVARAFLYLAEARVNKMNRRLYNWVLQRDITVQDLLAADINHSGFISKSEYIIYKLKEMGKIGERDISQVCNHFSKLDRYNCGKITLPDLLENHL